MRRSARRQTARATCKRRARGTAARQDEPAQRRQLRLVPIDQLLEPRHIVVPKRGLRDAGGDLFTGIGELRAEREQVALETHELGVDFGVGARRAGQTEEGVRLVDLAVRVDPRLALPDARAVEERRVAGVARARVDFHGRTELYEMQPKPTLAAYARREDISPDAAARAADRRRFRQRLLTWYRRHGRDLPWRKTDDPYHILVSEIMLQQTQVDRVLPKYAEWLEKYPSFDVLAVGSRARGDRDLVSARLQHQAETPAEHRARSRGEIRRTAAGRRGNAAVVQGHRRLHGRRHPELRVRRSARRFSTPTSRACCSASSSPRAIPRATP